MCARAVCRCARMSSALPPPPPYKKIRRRAAAEGIIKKVRFETFLSVKHLADKADGKRFELRVITGRSMQLLSNTAEDARKWVSTIKSTLGGSMAILRIQAVWRGHCARKSLRKVRAAREKAVASLAGGAGGGAGGKGGGAPGKALGTHAVHGVLKGKDESLIGGLAKVAGGLGALVRSASGKAADDKKGAAGAAAGGRAGGNRDERVIDGIVKIKLESACAARAARARARCVVERAPPLPSPACSTPPRPPPPSPAPAAQA